MSDLVGTNTNKLSELPSSVGLLKQLTILTAARNHLSKLPDSIRKLKQLIQLNLAQNCLQHLSPPILQMVNLTYLNLQRNQITYVPTNIKNLKYLSQLNLEGCNITYLTKRIEGLFHLRKLNLANNTITKLPKEIEKIDKLEILDLSNNPLTDHTHSLISNLNISERIQYLLEIQKPQTMRLNEAKVLVLGEERVGKTSLINRIFNRPIDNNQASTIGINIETCKLDCGIKVNIWDFAGQEITHQTHQFFLSKCSLYLLVIDAQNEDDSAKTRYWFNTIKITAGADAPIILIVNKMDLNPSFHFDLNRYKSEFNIVKVLYLSANNEKNQINTAHNVEDLKLEISIQVKKIKDVSLKFPPSWLAVKAKLEKNQKQGIDFVESKEFEDICKAKNITKDIIQDALLTILNQIGTIVTYKDYDALNVMQIINPEWVTAGVYKILRAEQINKNEAILTRAQFEQIFKGEAKYSKTRHFNWILNLLKQFQLAFSIGEEAVLIPARLPSTQPDFKLAHYQSGLNFRFKYSEILKKNIISRFIVLMHEYAGKQKIKYWQRGMFLQHGNEDTAHAVVIADEDKRTITIAINKNNRSARELMTIIRHCIRNLNGKQLPVKEQIPLIVENTVIGHSDFDDILDAEQQNLPIRKKVNGVYQSFIPKNLLDGYRIKDDTYFDYEIFIRDFISICSIETENKVDIYKENENSTNDRIRNGLLNRNYQVADQSHGGLSATGKTSGSRDFAIRNQQTGVCECIIEALDIKTFNSTKIIEHLKRLSEYDAVGNPLNILVSYVKTNNFDDTVEKYDQLFFKKSIGFRRLEDLKTNVVQSESFHGNQRILHVLVNFGIKKTKSLNKIISR